MILSHFIRNVFSDTIVYGVSKAITVLAGLVTLPILSRFLLVEEIGLFDYYNTAIVLVSSVAFFGLDSIYGLVITGNSKIRNDLHLESSILIIVLSGVLASFLIMLVFRKHIGIDIEVLWTYFVFVLPLNVLVLFYSNKAKWKRNKGVYLFITIGRALSILCGVLFLSKTGLLSLKTYLMLNILFRLVILVTLYCKKFIAWNPPSLQTISKLYRLASYLGFIAVSYALLPFLERLLVLDRLSAADLGRYTVMLKCTSLLLLVATIFNTVWGPLSLQLKIDGNYMRKVFIVTISYCYIFGVLLVGSFYDEILGFLVPGYAIDIGSSEIFLAGLNTAILSVNNLLETDFLRLNRTDTLFKLHIFTLAIGLVLSFYVDSLEEILSLYCIVYSLRLVFNSIILYLYDSILYSSFIPILLSFVLLLNLDYALGNMAIVVAFFIVAFVINVSYVTIDPKLKGR